MLVLLFNDLVLLFSAIIEKGVGKVRTAGTVLLRVVWEYSLL